MSEKLYGAKCNRCTHIRHDAEHEDPTIPWLSMNEYRECPGCSFCQEAALHRMIQVGGLDLFSPAVRESVKRFRRGESDPILDKLRIECQALTAHVVIGGETWWVADAQYDSSDLGSHLHLTLAKEATSGNA
jgi:hypothetical protein